MARSTSKKATKSVGGKATGKKKVTGKKKATSKKKTPAGKKQTATKKATPRRKTATKSKAVTQKAAPAPAAGTIPSIAGLREEIDRLFDRFNAQWPALSSMSQHMADFEPFRTWSRQWKLGMSPDVDIQESDRAYTVSAELPGLAEQDVDVVLQGSILTIKGEKTETREQGGDDDYHLTERRYGSFRRSFPVPPGVDTGNATAKFSNGVLVVTLPKTSGAREKRKVAVNSE